MLKVYCSDMKQSKPEKTQGEARFIIDKWILRTPLLLKASRGVKFLNIIESKDLLPQGQYMAGWNRYMLTEKAFNKLCEQYDFSSDFQLD